MISFLPRFFASGKRRALGLFLALLLAEPAAHAQAPAWQAAIACAQGESQLLFEVSALAADAGGNVYLAGSFAGTVSFGDIPLTSAGPDGHSDIFVAKWNSASARFVWVQQAGVPNDDAATALTVSGTNVYVAGDFQGPSAGFGTSLSSVGVAPSIIATMPS